VLRLSLICVRVAYIRANEEQLSLEGRMKCADADRWPGLLEQRVIELSGRPGCEGDGERRSNTRSA